MSMKFKKMQDVLDMIKGNKAMRQEVALEKKAEETEKEEKPKKPKKKKKTEE